MSRRLAWAVLMLIGLISLSAALGLSGSDGARRAGEAIQALGRLVESNYALAVALFVLLAFAAQLIVVPTGTLIGLAGGFLLGAPLAAGLYYAAQVTAAPIVYAAARAGFGGFADRWIDRIVARLWPGRRAEMLAHLRAEGVFAVVTMRLAPIFTSAVVPILSAAAGIRLWQLLLGSLLVSWIKPLLMAGIGDGVRAGLAAGAATGSTGAQGGASLVDLLAAVDVWPIVAAFAAALALLVARLVLRLHRKP